MWNLDYDTVRIRIKRLLEGNRNMYVCDTMLAAAHVAVVALQSLSSTPSFVSGEGVNIILKLRKILKVEK